MIDIQNFINGQYCPPISGNYFDNINPANGNPYARIPDSDKRDIENAVEAARAAYPAWRNVSEDDRYKILNSIAEGIENSLEELAIAESQDNGKPLSLARKVDIPRAAKNFRFYATAQMHFATDTHESRGKALNYTLRHPLGVVGCISPWNLPLYLFSWKIAPALAAGNTVVAKPSEITPMTAYLLGDICNKAGLPPGVLNIVHGYGAKAGEPIVTSPHIKAISFTGGTATGKRIAGIAAAEFKKLSLELGGKNPNIIFADCDYDKMISATVNSSFANQGQICLCGSRILVEETIYDQFVSDFVERISKLKVGHPSKKDTRIGAVVSESHMQKILDYIDLAKQEGGEIVFGGKKTTPSKECEGGFYVLPTIITGLAQSCRTNQEEIFGPVVTIQPFRDDEEALKLANSTQYGLSATVWTENLNRAQKFARDIDAGIVWINTWLFRDLRTPFGGIKQSGVGREGGFDALRFFTESKNVCISY